MMPTPTLFFLLLLTALPNLVAGNEVLEAWTAIPDLELMIVTPHTGEVRPYDLPAFLGANEMKRSDPEPFVLVFADAEGSGWKDSSLGPARQACITAAISYLLDRLGVTPGHPTWRIYFPPAYNDPEAKLLASANPTTVPFGIYRSYVDYEDFGLNALQILLQQGIDTLQPTLYHTTIFWNFAFPWYIPDACGVQVNQEGGDCIGSSYDFFTVAVHELTHALGFASSLTWGTPKAAPFNPPEPANENQTYVREVSASQLFPSSNRYDLGITAGPVASVFALGSDSASFSNQYIGDPDAGISDTLHNTGFFHHQLASRAFWIYSRNPYVPASSFSHWDDKDIPFLSMNYNLDEGALHRYWGLAEGGMMKDLLYINTRAENDECDAAHLVVFGSYSLATSFTPTPSAAPTSSSCSGFDSDVWYIFVPYFFADESPSLGFRFSAPNGLAIYELCTNTTTSTEITCSSNSDPVSLEFCTSACTGDQISSTQVYIRVATAVGSLSVEVVGDYTASEVFPARASNFYDSIQELNQFKINSAGDPFSFKFVPRITGDYSLYTDASDAVVTYDGDTFSANSNVGAKSISLTANTPVSIQVTSDPEATGHLRIYEPEYATCYRSLSLLRLGRSTFPAKYLPVLAATTICSTKTIYRGAWVHFTAPVNGTYTFSSCASTGGRTVVALTTEPCTEGSAFASVWQCGSACSTGSKVTKSMLAGERLYALIGLTQEIHDVDKLPVLTLDITQSSTGALCSPLPASDSALLDSPEPENTITNGSGYLEVPGAMWLWKRFTPCPGFDGSAWIQNFTIQDLRFYWGWCGATTGASVSGSYAIYLDPAYSGYPLNHFQSFELLGTGTFSGSAVAGDCVWNLTTVTFETPISWTSAGDIWVGLSFSDAYSGALTTRQFNPMSFFGDRGSDSLNPMVSGAVPRATFPSIKIALTVANSQQSTTSSRTIPSSSSALPSTGSTSSETSPLTTTQENIDDEDDLAALAVLAAFPSQVIAIAAAAVWWFCFCNA